MDQTEDIHWRNIIKTNNCLKRVKLFHGDYSLRTSFKESGQLIPKSKRSISIDLKRENEYRLVKVIMR